MLGGGKAGLTRKIASQWSSVEVRRTPSSARRVRCELPPGAREPRRDRGEVLLDQRGGDRVNGDVPILMRLGVLADFSTPLTT
jgi:hypothetical protein